MKSETIEEFVARGGTITKCESKGEPKRTPSVNVKAKHSRARSLEQASMYSCKTTRKPVKNSIALNLDILSPELRRKLNL